MEDPSLQFPLAVTSIWKKPKNKKLKAESLPHYGQKVEHCTRVYTGAFSLVEFALFNLGLTWDWSLAPSPLFLLFGK